MTVRLRVVLGEAIGAEDPDVAEAASSLTTALVLGAPRGCDVVGIAPRASADAPPQPYSLDIRRAPVSRRELAAAWRIGVPLGGAGGMIHSPSLMAPLVRHDRAHDHDQTVVTMWSLEAWTAPERLDRGDVAWQRAMLRRATRFADAVVVPTHAMAAELAEIAPLGGRVRVIAGAPREGFLVPLDAAGRMRALSLPERYVVVLGRIADHDGMLCALSAVASAALDVVVIGVPEDDVPCVAGAAQVAGIEEGRMHAPVSLGASDRAAILAGAVVVLAASAATAFPWRALEALAVGAPTIAVRTPQNEELLADGAYLVAPDDPDTIGEALRRVIEEESLATRLRVQAADRARAFSWRDAAERVWQLHAEL